MPNDTENQIRRGQVEDIYRSRVTSGTRNPQTMRPEEIVEEIDSLRETINLASQRVIDLSRTLYAQVRRAAGTPSTPAYIAYSNAWSRLAGAIQQGLRRNVTASRILSRVLEDQRLEADKSVAKSPKPKEKSSGSPARSSIFDGQDPLRDGSLNDLMHLYGSEIVRDA